MTTHNIVSVSGGKDSTATLLLAIALEVPNLRAVFADTGHEHPETYDYVNYLSQATGVPIKWVKADFTERLAAQRSRLQRFVDGEIDTRGKYRWTPERARRAIELLQPTGNPFLDLCLSRGAFPSTRRRFCTDELKRDPLIEQVFLPLMGQGEMILSWQGIRLDESESRRIRLQGTGAFPITTDEVGGGLFNYRPILRWTVADVFEAHKLFGIKPNPLYVQGCGRVGCMPCVNVSKGELREIGSRFPDQIARVREWEAMVSEASKAGASTFLPAVTDPVIKAAIKAAKKDGQTFVIDTAQHGIDRMVEWANTNRGGRQFDVESLIVDLKTCSSSYGLCDSSWEPVKLMEAA